MFCDFFDAFFVHIKLVVPKSTDFNGASPSFIRQSSTLRKWVHLLIGLLISGYAFLGSLYLCTVHQDRATIAPGFMDKLDAIDEICFGDGEGEGVFPAKL